MSQTSLRLDSASSAGKVLGTDPGAAALAWFRRAARPGVLALQAFEYVFIR